MKVFTKKRVIWGLVVIVALLILASFLRSEEEAGIEFVLAERGKIVQEKSVTGKIQPQIDVELAFETSGKVVAVYKKVGDSVTTGSPIAALNSSELQADLLSAKAKQRAEESRLEELQLGSREEDIKIKESELLIAELDLSNYYDDTERILRDALNNADSAINIYIDDLFSNDNTLNPNLTFLTNNQQAEFDSEFGRYKAGNALSDFKNILDTLSDEPELLDEAIKLSRDKMAEIESFLITISAALNGAQDLSAATLAAYKSDLNTARDNVNTELTSIDNHKQSINSAKATVEKRKRELNLALAGSTEQAINAQIAKVDDARASVLKIESQIAKTVLRSPTDGIVTQQDAKVGEVVAANTTLASVISGKAFEIVAYIVEADIADVKIGDSARLTLDAYGEDLLFMAHVVMKDPAETVTEGVTTYKTTLQFDEEDERIQSGMTANLDIVTAERENVVLVPRKAVIFKNGDKLVRVLVGEEIVEKKVEIGIDGISGNTEILSGLEEGEQVITSLNGS